MYYSWDVHASKPSTHVITPLKLGALREVARDNMLRFSIIFLVLFKKLNTKTSQRNQSLDIPWHYDSILDVTLFDSEKAN